MEALAAVSLAGNIVGFIEFGSKLVAHIREISESASGATQDNVDMSLLVDNLSFYIERLRQPGMSPAPTEKEQKLLILASRCSVLAKELDWKVKKLTVAQDAKFKRLSSAWKALKGVWKKEDLERKMARLDQFRSEFQLEILDSLKWVHYFQSLSSLAYLYPRREDYDLVSIQSSEHFKLLNEQGKYLIQTISQGREIFEQGFARQAILMQDLHRSTNTELKQHFDQKQAEVIEVVTKKHKQQQSQDSERRENAILQHLSFPTMKVRYENIDPAHARTFNWIFEGSMRSTRYKFSTWLEGSEKKLYWINGKPGSGKSTLMKYIVEDARTKEKLQKWAGGWDLTIISFFFWISGNPDQCSHTGLLRALLHDLLKKHRGLIKQIFPDLWEVLENPDVLVELRAWTVSYASEALNKLLGQNIGKVALFIDGLDEYNGEYNDLSSPEKHEKEYRKIIDQIHSLISPDRGDIKICFSSRPYQVFHRYFDRQPKLSLQDLTYDDIRKYTEDELQRGPAGLHSSSLSDREISSLVSQVVRHAEGIFLWVRLVVKSLLDGIDNSDDFEVLERRLARVPSSLMGLYRHMLEQIEPQYRKEAIRIFAITDAAFSQADKFGKGTAEWASLTMLDLYFALDYSGEKSCFRRYPNVLPGRDYLDKAAEQMSLKLRTRCLGLIEVEHFDEDEHSDTGEAGDEAAEKTQTMVEHLSYLTYIHRSVKEFLDLEETRSFFKRATDNDYDPEVSLIWSAVQLISIVENLDSSEDKTFHLVNQALLYAVSLLREGRPSPSWLLDILDDTMQLNQSQRELSWATEMIDQLGLSFSWRYTWPHRGRTISDMTKLIGCNLRDDFLSLAIIYGLTDYVVIKFAEQPSQIKKPGRPYLDYALTTDWLPHGSVNPYCSIDLKMVQILLQAGADVNEHCPTIYNARMTQVNEPIKESINNTWTPWKSALDSVMSDHVVVDHLDMGPRHVWLEVFKLLLDKEPDVSVLTSKRIGHWEDYAVSEIIAYVFGVKYPKDTARLLARVEELAHAKKCSIYKQRLVSEVMDRLRKTLVPHLEMTEAQEAYWGLEDKALL
ncbi:hypothetical protein IFR04_013156 [Cadophora malorum]|uniref:NACHT domain-containing protein n=1 Tax=Cadophora malorum TaxID=108018 RepID=A0A8H7T7I4_9HELO|nr:hypothetical protein IFR04_013156 [Cadophora malorum]